MIQNMELVYTNVWLNNSTTKDKYGLPNPRK